MESKGGTTNLFKLEVTKNSTVFLDSFSILDRIKNTIHKQLQLL